MTNTRPKWTQRIGGIMALERINYSDIAAKYVKDDGTVGCSKAFICSVFNGDKTPPDAESKFMAAIEAVRAERRKH